MRTPGLRLRQVFEHANHFKVQKPTGETITIAKKGLSPSTVGRLRRFAQGGEVRNYQVGGEIADPSELDAAERKLSEDASALAQSQGPQEAAASDADALPASAEAPGIVAAQGKRKVIKSEQAQETQSEEERRAADFARLRERYAAQPAAAPAPTAPVPVQVNISTGPTPAPALVPAPEPVPAKTETPAPIPAPPVAAPPQKPGAFEATEEDFSNTEGMSDRLTNRYFSARAAGMSPADALLGVTEAEKDIEFLNQKPEDFVAKYWEGKAAGLTSEQSAKRASAEVAPPSTIPATTAPPAPNVTAPVVPAAPVSVTPIAPPVPVAAAARPVAAPAPAAPVPVAAAPAPTPAAPAVPVAATAPVAPPADGGVMTDEQIEASVRVLPLAYQATARMGLTAMRDEYMAQQKQNEAALKLVEDQTKAAKDLEQSSLEKINKARELRDDVSDRIKLAMSRGNFFSEMNIWGKLGTLAAMALSGYATGYAGIPNYALDAFNKALERDIERQRRDVDSLVSQFKAITGSEEAGVELYKSVAKEAMALQLKQAEMQSSNAKTRAAAAAASAKFMNDAINTAASAELKAAQTELAVARTEGELTAAEKMSIELSRKAEREKRFLLEERRLREQAAARKVREKEHELAVKGKDEKWRSDRTFYAANAAEIPLIAGTPAQARKAETEILGQTDALYAAHRVLKVLKENPVEAYVPKTTANQQAQLALAQFLERYPKSERFGRPLNLTASRVIKTGIPSTDASGILSKAFGDPLVVMRELIKDAEQSRADAIKTYGGRTPEAAKQAAEAIKKHDDSVWGPDIDFQPAGSN